MTIARHDFDREDAIRILSHYLRRAHEAAGGEWTGDNHGDVIALVDAILRCAASQFVSIQQRVVVLETDAAQGIV